MKLFKKFQKKLRRERQKQGIIETIKIKKQETNVFTKTLKQLQEKYDLAKHNIYNETADLWTDNFEDFCKYQNFNFDEVLLFMGGPLWDSENLKQTLLDAGHGIILQSSNRYEIKT